MRLPVPEGEQHCRVCGCWEKDRCRNTFGGRCWWVYKDLCSFCYRDLIQSKKKS